MFKIGFYVLSAATAALFFVGGPDYYSPRTWRLAWDLGHLLAFFAWTAAALSASHRFAAEPVDRQMLIALPIVLLASLGIEWTQSAFGRSFALADIVNNVLGSATAIAFLSPARHLMHKPAVRAAQGTVVALVLLQLLPLAQVVVDDVIAWQRFPILSDLETPFEHTRWTSRSAIAIDRQVVRQGNASLQVRLMPGKYSGISLLYFPSDWRDYTAVSLSVFNGSSSELRVTCRIHDEKHIHTGQRYSDRFNQTFVLKAGWNDITIPTKSIRDAPQGRRMNLQRVRDVSLILTDLHTPRTIYVDDVRLIN